MQSVNGTRRTRLKIVKAAHKGLQFIQLKGLDDDISGIDWVLKPDYK